jgi:signal transduction histidine kinase
VSWLVLAIAQPRQVARYLPQPKAGSPFHRYIAVAMVVLGLLMVFRNATFFVADIVWPIAFVVTGFLIAWTRHRDSDGVAAVVRILAGVVVGVGGMIAFLTVSSGTGFADAFLVLVIGVAVILGIALVAAPSLARIGRELDDERQNRVRADERARVAAHLHDSVLQTLTLIQHHADDPARTAQLARHQERALRSWLYRPDAVMYPGTLRLRGALEEVVSEVEDEHVVSVKMVVVGDATEIAPESADRLAALIGASREAMVNAARHSGVSRIDLFAERLDDRIEVFVRDTGAGFDPNDVGSDRRGVRESIDGRMRRAGGTADVRTVLGAGTEIVLTMPIPQDAADAASAVSSGPTTDVEASR